MSEAVKAIILGVVQGLAEFLPISSSGHLVLFSNFLDFHKSGLAFDVFVHFGTLVAVLIVFRKDVWEMIRWLPAIPAFLMGGLKVENEEDEYKAMAFYIVVATIPAAVIGLLFKDVVEVLFANIVFVFIALVVTALIMWSSRYTEEDKPFMNLFHAIVLGFAQAFAIIPGISRSGSTIVAALWMGIKRETAAKFSFLMSIPVILGASILQFKELMETGVPQDELITLILGTLSAGISGYFAIIWMLEIIKKQKLEWFGLYCAVLGLGGMAFMYFNG